MIEEQQAQALIEEQQAQAFEQKMQELIKAELARQTVELRGCCRSANFGNLAKGLGALQAAVANPVRDRQVEITTKTGHKYRFKYADLASCLDVIRPLLAANGLCILQSCSLIDARAVCVTELLHTSGEFWRSELAFAGSGDIKDLAGTFTYLRRYALCPILGLAPEDEDSVEREVGDEKQAKAAKNPHPAAERATGRQPNQAQPAQGQAQPEKPPAQKPAEKPPEQKPAEKPSGEPKQEPKAAASGPASDGGHNRAAAIMKKLAALFMQVDGVANEDGSVNHEKTFAAASDRLAALNEASPFGQVCAVDGAGKPSLKLCTVEQLKDIKAIYDALLVEKEAG